MKLIGPESGDFGILLLGLTSSGKNVDGFSIGHADDLVRLEPGAVDRPVDHVVEQERAETGLILHQFS